MRSWFKRCANPEGREIWPILKRLPLSVAAGYADCCTLCTHAHTK